jgi:hypothetical protein
VEFFFQKSLRMSLWVDTLAAQSKATRPQQPEPSSALFFIVVACAAANAEWSTRVEWSATDTVEELRRRSERAMGKRRSNSLLVE